MRVRNFWVPRWGCENQHKYDSIVLAGVVDTGSSEGMVSRFDVEQIRFFRVVRMQIIEDDPKLGTDYDACIAVTSYPLIRHDSSAVASENPLDFFQTVQQDVRRVAADFCLRYGLWGTHVSNGVGRFQELRIGERTFYEVSVVSKDDSTKFCDDTGVELLHAAQGKVFEIYLSSRGILNDALPVAGSLVPRD